MRKISKNLVLVLFLAVSVVSVSCKKDDMESIVLKRSGSLSVTIVDGETPVADAKVRFHNEDTGNEIDVYVTDEQGRVEFGQLNEGSYAVEVEVLSPYAVIYQEIQIISGENTNRTIQISEYVGTYIVELLDEDTDEVVKEDLGLGVALIPDNNALERAKSDEEVIALATTIEYFGADGEITFTVPVGRYVAFAVRGDSILYDVDDFYLDKLEEHYENFNVDINWEKIINKASWSVGSAKDQMDADVAGFPVTSMKFKSDNQFEMILEGGVIISGYYELDSDGDIYFGSYQATDENLYIYIDGTSLMFDEAGKLVLYLDDFDMEGTYDVELYDIFITLE